MKEERHTIFRSILATYIILFALLSYNHYFILSSLLKPGAAILAYYALTYILKEGSMPNPSHGGMKTAFRLWIFVDVISAGSEIYFHQNHLEVSSLFVIEAVMYLGIRLIILVSCVRIYLVLTEKYNRFQRFADIFTVVSCVISTMWIIFFAMNSAESIRLMLSLNMERILSEIYRLVSMMTLGILLISWFHYQYSKITFGQRFLLSGLAMISFTDLAITFNNGLLHNNMTNMVYIAGILMIAIGCEMYGIHQWSTLFLSERDERERLEVSWRNMGYFFVYPIQAALFVGLRPEFFAYAFLFAFYFTACQYVKQLSITDHLLIGEKEKNRRLQMYSDVLEQAALSVVITDQNGDIEYVNPYFTKVSKYTLQEVKGKNPRILKSEKANAGDRKILRSSLVNGERWVGEFVNLDKDGNEFVERAVISPMKDEDGNVISFVAIKDNITDDRRMEQQLDTQNRFITQLVNTIPSSIFYVTKDNVFIEANTEFDRVYEVDSKSFKGMPFENTPWMNQDRYMIFVEMKEETIHKHEPVTRQIIRRQGGKATPVLYCVNAYYTKDGAVGGILGIMTDISELKEKEVELQKALTEANAAKDTKALFLANMSHEIRTPMNAIIGMSFLALKTELTEKQRDYIVKINNAASALLGIINDILDFSKIESGKVEMENVDFQLDNVITNSIEFLVQKAQEKELDFIYYLPCTIPKMIKGDSLRLGQVLTNLVSNAIKFTEKGEIRIDVHEEKRTEHRICLKFSVKDTGIGISEDKQLILFDAFTQSDNSTTREYGGTGLGLSICKSLVELMEGRIWIESALHKGSTFHFTAWFDFEEDNNVRRDLVLDDIRKLKTLVVDDNSASREILQEYLEHMGFSADTAQSGNQAIEMLQTKPYHLLFVDWKMPGMGGVETIQKISEMQTLDIRPSTVLITAYDREEMKKHARGVEVDGFLAKPVSQSCLYDEIVRLFVDNLTPAANKAVQQEDYQISGVHVLLAEDNGVNQQIACELLEDQGVHVDVAGNGKEATEKYFGNPGLYDMILMDLQMPEMDGLEATETIRNRMGEIPIIAMTARTMQQEIEKCFEAGMNDHISKPINPDKLFSVVAKWRQRSTAEVRNLSKEKVKKVDLDQNHAIQNANLDKIYGIQVKLGLTRVAGNIEFYQELLLQFAQEQPETIEATLAHCKNRDYGELGRSIHLLKGVSGNISAMGVYELSVGIEKLVRENAGIHEIELLVQELAAEFEKVCASIHEFVAKQPPDQEKDAVMEAVSMEEYQSTIRQLTEMLKEGDVSAVEHFTNHRSLLGSRAEALALERIALLITKYEFDAAITELAELERGVE